MLVLVVGVGCWLLVVGCWLLVVGWLLVCVVGVAKKKLIKTSKNLRKGRNKLRFL